MEHQANPVEQARAEARAHEVARRWPEAVACWQTAADVGGGAQSLSDRDLVAYSRVLRSAGRPDEAEALIAARLHDSPDGTALLAEHAEIASRGSDASVAVARWRALWGRGDHARTPRLYVMLTRMLHRERRFVEADQVLDEGLHRFPRAGRLVALRAQSLRRSGQWARAGDCIEAAIADGIDVGVDGVRMLAGIHIRNGDPDAALRVLARDGSARAAGAGGRPDDLHAQAAFLRSLPDDLQAMASVLSCVRGRQCVVFGSAPMPALTRPAADYADHLMVSCNGSSASMLSQFGWTPHVSFINDHVLLRTEAADREVVDALADVTQLGAIIVLRSTAGELSLGGLDRKAQSITAFPWEGRFLVLRRLLDTALPILDISTGAFAAAAVLGAGAASVELVGFSLLGGGHSYNQNGRRRNHVSSDAGLFALLGLREFDIRSADPVIASICRRMIG